MNTTNRFDLNAVRIKSRKDRYLIRHTNVSTRWLKIKNRMTNEIKLTSNQILYPRKKKGY